MTSRSYLKLDRDPLKKILKVANEIKNSNLDDTMKIKLYPKDYIHPQIYGSPKIHKDNVSLWPIVNTICSLMYKLAKFFAHKLKPLVGNTIPT